MAHIIAVANQKGGVGKTTTAVNLAASLAVLERQVILIDADPQANATSGLGVEVGENDPSIYEVLIGHADMASALRETNVPYLRIVPSKIDLVGAEVELVNFANREQVLRRAMKTLPADADYVIIDCAPSLGLITVNALTAADSVLIPVQCEYFALEGLGKLLNTIRLVQQSLNPNLTIEGVLLTMFDARLRLSNHVAQEVRRYFKELTFRTVINRNVRLSEAPSHGMPVLMYDIKSTGAQNYLSLAQEIIQRNEAVASAP